jgi:mannose-1-phosphate guanylyltransferase/mannose-6-phosphate isomerase
MCGGAGARLWPVSRESMPKQFVRLVGLHQVLALVTDCELFTSPIVISNGEFRFVVAEQLRERGIEADIILEPVRRDSGPAVAGFRRACDATRSRCISACAGCRPRHSQG